MCPMRMLRCNRDDDRSTSVHPSRRKRASGTLTDLVEPNLGCTLYPKLSISVPPLRNSRSVAALPEHWQYRLPPPLCAAVQRLLPVHTSPTCFPEVSCEVRRHRKTRWDASGDSHCPDRDLDFVKAQTRPLTAVASQPLKAFVRTIDFKCAHQVRSPSFCKSAPRLTRSPAYA